MGINTGNLKLSRNYDKELKFKVYGNLQIKKLYQENGEPHNPIREHFKSNQKQFFGKLDDAVGTFSGQIGKKRG